MVAGDGSSRTERYLTQIGVIPTPRATCPFDPGYDPATLEGHLEQSGHLMGTLKISMACWMVADEGATRRKTRAAARAGIPAVAGGGPFETAVAQRALPSYLDLCADVGLTRVECGEGFTQLTLEPRGDRAPGRVDATSRWSSSWARSIRGGSPTGRPTT